MTPDEAAAFDLADQRSEALELEFGGELLEPVKCVFPVNPSTLRGRKYSAQQHAHRMEVQRARRRLAARGYHVEAA